MWLETQDILQPHVLLTQLFLSVDFMAQIPPPIILNRR